MGRIAATLKQKLYSASKVVVLGVGSDLRGDDIAGILAAEQIKKITQGRKKHPKVEVFIGATAPENFTGEIKRIKPSHLIIIDSADMNIQAGQIRIIDADNIGGTSFCTHSLPIKVMVDYLLQSCNCQVIIIGVQPKDLSVGSSISKKVEAAVEKLVGIISKILVELN